MKQKPHKHAEFIKAWAEGTPIEVKVPRRDDWVLLDSSNGFFKPSYEYRIAEPKYVTIGIRHYAQRVSLTRPAVDGNIIIGTIHLHNDENAIENEEKAIENDPLFIDWVSGWMICHVKVQ